jgi:hypothetical protein
MTFVTYSPFDAIGTAAGLSLLEKVVNGLLNGSFLGVGILAVFAFLSFAKIAIDTIVGHRYIPAVIEFLRLTVVMLLFTVTTTSTIFNMSIINFGYAGEAAQNGSTLIGSHLGGWLYGANNFNPSSTQSQVTNVPLIADLYVIPDNLAYQFANVMLNPSQTMTIDLTSLLLDPKSILDAGLASLANSSNDKSAIMEEFAKCYDRSAYKAFRRISDANMSCEQFNQEWADASQQIVNQIKQQGYADPVVLQDMNYLIYLLKNDTLQDVDSFKEAYLGTELKELDESAQSLSKLYASYNMTSIGQTGNCTYNNASPGTIITPMGPVPVNGKVNAKIKEYECRAVHNLAAATQVFFSKLGEIGSHGVTQKQFLEELMLHLQEYAIAIMFLLLPFVVIIGLLPIFGSNYKLLIRYATAFFLIKLWIPILWFVYVGMENVSAILMDTGSSPTQTAQGSVATLAYAMQYVEAAHKYTQINNLIISAMYVLIPAILGSPATYLVGKGLVEASVAGFLEGTRFMKSLGSLIVRATTFIAGLFVE